jgi:predicted nuclease of restriction endonuclease-like RecB superfamily
VRFSLQDIPKSIHRSNGELGMKLTFLHMDDMQEVIGKLIDYYERALGIVQRAFLLDEVRASIGDYRLANCLIATMSNWYSWRSRDWSQVVMESGGNELLVAVSSPIQLRLVLYTYINEHYHGFLIGEQREQVLTAFAQNYGIDARQLDYLLAIDSEAEAVLTRTSEHVPGYAEVVACYNQWAFEAALCNASEVCFTIDYRAFSAVEKFDGESVGHTASMGIGAVIKRLCYLARVLGVYYDLEYINTTTDAEPTLLKLTLYGPQDVTGLPQQYGLRLARLCRVLLGYSVSSTDGRGQSHQRKRSSLSRGISTAEARVHLLQRDYRFTIDDRLLQLLPLQQPPDERHDQESMTVFDSSIEQLFAEAFAASSRSSATDGWLLEREPEPLLLTQGIFIPDFALTRAQKRIYVEILGFWTPAYRERKIQKLLQLQTRGDLLLAIPVEAKEAFVSIATLFPIVYYHGQLSATEILQVLRDSFDDFDERLQQINVAEVQMHVEQAGLLEEQQCYSMLHCYRRSELQEAARRICESARNIVYIPGLGFYQQHWFTDFQAHFLDWFKGVSSAPLSTVIYEIRNRWSELRSCADSTVEILINLCAETQVQHQSLFESTVEYVGMVAQVSEEKCEHEVTMSVVPEKGIEETRNARRREREGTKKRSKVSKAQVDVVQKDLWA